MVLLPGVPSALQAADERVRVLEARDIALQPARAGVSHEVRLSVHTFRGGLWDQEESAAAVVAAARLIEQCGVGLSVLEVRVLETPRRFRFYATRDSRALLRRLPARKPAIFFVDDTHNVPPFDAEAIGRANASSRPELADTIWVAHGTRDLRVALAHELVHLLSDSGAHSEEPQNLMRAETSPANVRLTDAQCRRLRARGEANGLLAPLGKKP